MLKFLKCKKESGYTLLELLIVMAIIGVTLTVISTTFLTAYRGYLRSRILNQLQEEGNRLTEEVSRLVRSSRSVRMLPAGPFNATNLQLTLSQDSIEYAQNGNCDVITLRYTPANFPPIPPINGRLELLSSCPTFNKGGVLTDTDTVTGYSINKFDIDIIDNDVTETQRVNFSILIEQGEDAPSRSEYQASIEITTGVNTRDYFN